MSSEMKCSHPLEVENARLRELIGAKFTIKTVELHKHEGGFRLDWTASSGFGVLLFTRDADGSVWVDSEMMGKEFIAAVLLKFLEQCTDTRE